MSPTLNFGYCFTGFIGRGADFACMSVFVSKSCQKSKNIHLGLRQYNYTHDQLNTR